MNSAQLATSSNGENTPKIGSSPVAGTIYIFELQLTTGPDSTRPIPGASGFFVFVAVGGED